MPIVRIEHKINGEFNAASLVKDVHAALLSDPTVTNPGGLMVFPSKIDDCAAGKDGAGQMCLLTVNFKDGVREPEQEDALIQRVFDAAVNNLNAAGHQDVLVHVIKLRFPKEGGILSRQPPEAPAASAA